MDIYHIWCELKPGVRDLDFVSSAQAYLAFMEEEGLLAGYRITRRKLGLAADGLREFHLMLEFVDMTQLDEAFGLAASRAGVVEGLHAAVYSKVEEPRFALYRDFPDEVRELDP